MSVLSRTAPLLLPLLLLLRTERCRGSDALDALEELRLYASDRGNDDVVIDVPEPLLDRFFSNVVNGASVPLSPSFYAGTDGAPSVSIDDANGRYPLLLKPLPRSGNGERHLPDPDVVFDRIFRREEFLPERRTGGNMLLPSWSSWVWDEFFRTEPGTDGALFRFRTDGAAPSSVVRTMRLGQLYGTDPLREKALRTYEGGKLKSNERGGLPSLTDVRKDFEYFTVSCGGFDDGRNASSCRHDDDDDWRAATGHEDFNSHPGLLTFAELFLREHNYVADLLRHRNPEWNDQRIFEVARVILIHLASKFVWEEYVSGAVSPAKDNVKFRYDPDLLRERDCETPQNRFYLEFDHSHRAWRSLLAEEIEFKGGDTINFQELIRRPSEYEERGGGSAFVETFRRTPMGALGPRNTPSYLRSAFTQTVKDERAQNMRGFNAYRQHFGLPPLATFEDFNAGPNVAQELKELYESVDDVDFFVGIVTEQRFSPGATFLSETALSAFASFAFAAMLNFDTINDPYLFSEELLTEFGLNHIRQTSMVDMINRHFDVPYVESCGTPLLLEPHGTCAYTEIEAGEADGEWRNMEDFVGLDFVLEPFYSGGYMTDVFLCFLYCAMALAFVFFLVHNLMQRKFGFYKDYDTFEKFRFAFGAVNVATLLLTAIPYTFFVMKLLFGDAIAALEDDNPILFSFLLLHGLLYFVETCGGLVYSPSGNKVPLLHHAVWYAMIVIAVEFRSVFFLKLVFVWDSMSSYEASSFLAMMLHRHSDNLKLRVKTALVGIVIFFVTRLLQMLLLMHLFSVSADRMWNSTYSENDEALLLVGAMISAILGFCQIYNLAVYCRIYRRDSKREEDEAEEPDLRNDSSKSMIYSVTETATAEDDGGDDDMNDFEVHVGGSSRCSSSQEGSETTGSGSQSHPSSGDDTDSATLIRRGMGQLVIVESESEMGSSSGGDQGHSSSDDRSRSTGLEIVESGSEMGDGGGGGSGRSRRSDDDDTSGETRISHGIGLEIIQSSTEEGSC